MSLTGYRVTIIYRQIDVNITPNTFCHYYSGEFSVVKGNNLLAQEGEGIEPESRQQSPALSCESKTHT